MRTRMRGAVGAGGENPLATRLGWKHFDGIIVTDRKSLRIIRKLVNHKKSILYFLKMFTLFCEFSFQVIAHPCHTFNPCIWIFHSFCY